jgi:hypothetical protein
MDIRNAQYSRVSDSVLRLYTTILKGAHMPLLRVAPTI